MAPGTEFARDFCGGIGPLQLGVVLVFFLFLFFLGGPSLSKAKKEILALGFILANLKHDEAQFSIFFIFKGVPIWSS